nr:MAG: replication-associated protein [Canine stool-associated circular virus]
MTQARCWCGTLNSVPTDFDGLQFFKAIEDKLNYAVGQVEIGNETGTVHFQFYLQLRRSQRLSWLKTKVSNEAHFEVAKGSPEQNKEYCTKVDTRAAGPWEIGMMNTQGKAAGLERATELIKAGTPVQEVAEFFPVIWVKHGRGLLDLRKTLKLECDRRQIGPNGPELWVLYGESGSGKSRFVNEHWPDAYWKTPYSQWWDGYAGHETVVLDDFKDDWMRLTDFQRLIDYYPLWVEIKGGSLPMMATRYVITSNVDPEEWYQRADKAGTVMRRIRDFAEQFGRLLSFPLSPTGRAAADSQAAPCLLDSVEDSCLSIDLVN